MATANVSGPFGLSAADWRRAVVQVWSELSKDNITILAAALAFYGMLSLFPGLIAIVSLYGLFLDPAQVEDQMRAIYGVLPPTAAALVADQLHELVENRDGTLQLSLVLSLLGLLWSASSGVDALVAGVNLAYFERETRSMFRLRAVALATTLGLILFLVVAIAAVAVLPAALSWLGVDPRLLALLSWMRWPVLAAMVMLGLALLYRYAPDRQEPPRWRWVSPGSIAGTLLWLLASFGFSFYVTKFGSYNETYGALGAVIVLLLWLWLGALSALIGAELNAVLEQRAGRLDPSAPGRRGTPQLGERGDPAEKLA